MTALLALLATSEEQKEKNLVAVITIISLIGCFFALRTIIRAMFGRRDDDD